MNSTESVAVALAAYNGGPFIARQLDSLLAQSLLPDKIVVVDDGSTDNTPQILDDYAERYPAIEVHRNQRNLGYIKNFEKAVRLCRTDYVALSDQDDIWHPDKLTRCVGALRQHRGAGLCYHNAGLLDMADQRIDLTLWDLSDWEFPLTKGQVQSKVADRRGPVPGFALVLHRDLVAQLLPVPGSLYCGHDWWINALAFFLFDPVCIPDPLVFYRMHPGQVSGAASVLLKGTGFEKKKRLFDLNRLKRNFKREFHRLIHRRAVLARKRQDAFAVRDELGRCLEALRGLVLDNNRIGREERKTLAAFLLRERQLLLDPPDRGRR